MRWAVKGAAVVAAVAGAIAGAWAIACAQRAAAPAPKVLESVVLPGPRRGAAGSLEAALAARRSLRAFADAPVAAADRAQPLWAAQGVTSPAGGRTAPSAGALYPLEVYAVDRTGVYHYDPRGHRLELIRRGDLGGALAAVTYARDAIRGAPLRLIVTGVVARTAKKYGARAERYVWIEAGAAAENVLLEATSLGLGAVPVGAFDDAKVQAALGLPADHVPILIVAIGRPR